jgi:hypothetical protein
MPADSAKLTDFTIRYTAADRLHDRFGESSLKLATGMRGNFRERTHENPAGLPGKNKPGRD